MTDMKNFGKLKLKSNAFDYIRVCSDSYSFSDLKAFCLDDISISYENAMGIGFYWLIRLNDALKEKWVTVPDGSYIIKIPGGFTILSEADKNELFDDVC